MPANLEDAIILAATLHKGQVDKGGSSYILHPLRVMFRLKSERARIVGVLHDVLEDCDITPADLRAKGYDDKIIEALDYLTKRPEEENDYDAFIMRVATGPELAKQVKIADLEENLDLSRIDRTSEADLLRVQKYKRAVATLKVGF